MPRTARLSSLPEAIFVWLTDLGPAVQPAVRDVLILRLFSAPEAVFLGALNCLIVDCLALWLSPGWTFAVLAILELLCMAVRLSVLGRIRHLQQQGGHPSIRPWMATSIVWTGLLGGTAFASMVSGEPTVQIMAASMVMCLSGPICARNYPVPRYAFLLLLLADMPYVAGSCLSGRPWLIMLVPLTPPFLLGSWKIVTSLNQMAVALLTAEFESRHRACHDPMTNLLNRRGFEDALASLSAGQAENCALLCLDLDGFKAVNDTLGHHAGDALLQGVAGRLLGATRQQDSVFRLGGDEFSILVHHLPPEAVEAMAERIIETVSTHPYCCDGLPPMRVGVSIGYACGPRDGRTLAELHRNADAALYASKAAGKGVQRRFKLAS